MSGTDKDLILSDIHWAKVNARANRDRQSSYLQATRPILQVMHFGRLADYVSKLSDEIILIRDGWSQTLGNKIVGVITMKSSVKMMMISAVVFCTGATQTHGQMQSIDLCQKDIKQHCVNVQKGHGHVLACLYAHEDDLTSSCERAISVSSVVIDAAIGHFEDSIISCTPEIRKFCSEASTDLEVLKCLGKHTTALDKGCASNIEFISKRYLNR